MKWKSVSRWALPAPSPDPFLVFTQQGSILIAFRISKGRRGQWIFCQAHDYYNSVCNCGVDASDGDNTLYQKITHWIPLKDVAPGIKEINEEQQEGDKNH